MTNEDFKEILHRRGTLYIFSSQRLYAENYVLIAMKEVYDNCSNKLQDTAKEYEQKLSEAQEDISIWKKTAETVSAINEKLEKELAEKQAEIERLNLELTQESYQLMGVKKEIDSLKKHLNVAKKAAWIEEKGSLSPDAVGKAIEALAKLNDHVFCYNPVSDKDFFYLKDLTQQALTLLQSANQKSKEA